MTNKSERTRQRTNNLKDELIWDELCKKGCGNRSVYSDCRFFPLKKRKCCNHRCLDSVYFNRIYAVVNYIFECYLICRREMSLIGFTTFGFAQNTYMVFKIPH